MLGLFWKSSYPLCPFAPSFSACFDLKVGTGVEGEGVPTSYWIWRLEIGDIPRSGFWAAD